MTFAEDPDHSVNQQAKSRDSHWVCHKGSPDIQPEQKSDRSTQATPGAIIKSKVIQWAKRVMMANWIADPEEYQRTQPDERFFPVPDPRNC